LHKITAARSWWDEQQGIAASTENYNKKEVAPLFKKLYDTQGIMNKMTDVNAKLGYYKTTMNNLVNDGNKVIAAVKKIDATLTAEQSERSKSAEQRSTAVGYDERTIERYRWAAGEVVKQEDQLRWALGRRDTTLKDADEWEKKGNTLVHDSADALDKANKFIASVNGISTSLSTDVKKVETGDATSQQILAQVRKSHEESVAALNQARAAAEQVEESAQQARLDRNLERAALASVRVEEQVAQESRNVLGTANSNAKQANEQSENALKLIQSAEALSQKIRATDSSADATSARAGANGQAAAAAATDANTKAQAEQGEALEDQTRGQKTAREMDAKFALNKETMAAAERVRTRNDGTSAVQTEAEATKDTTNQQTVVARGEIQRARATADDALALALKAGDSANAVTKLLHGAEASARTSMNTTRETREDADNVNMDTEKTRERAALAKVELLKTVKHVMAAVEKESAIEKKLAATKKMVSLAEQNEARLERELAKLKKQGTTNAQLSDVLDGNLGTMGQEQPALDARLKQLQNRNANTEKETVVQRTNELKQTDELQTLINSDNRLIRETDSLLAGVLSSQKATDEIADAHKRLTQRIERQGEEQDHIRTLVEKLHSDVEVTDAYGRGRG